MTDDYAELREDVLLPSPDAGRWPRFDPSVIAALLADRDRLAEAAEDVSETLSRNNIDFSGLASQYPAVYYVGMAIQKLRAALRGSGAAEEAGRG